MECLFFGLERNTPNGLIGVRGISARETFFEAAQPGVQIGDFAD
jgi:hypothetical protein